MAERRYVIETFIYPGIWSLREPYRFKRYAKFTLRRRIKRGYRSRLRDVRTSSTLSD